MRSKRSFKQGGHRSVPASIWAFFARLPRLRGYPDSQPRRDDRQDFWGFVGAEASEGTRLLRMVAAPGLFFEFQRTIL